VLRLRLPRRSRAEAARGPAAPADALATAAGAEGAGAVVDSGAAADDVRALLAHGMADALDGRLTV